MSRVDALSLLIVMITMTWHKMVKVSMTESFVSGATCQNYADML